MTALATTTLAAASGTITFSSIPATYRDLVFVMDGKLDVDTPTEGRLYFNADQGSTYSRVFMYADGSSYSSGAATLTGGITPLYLRGNQANAIVQIFDYAETNKHKTVLSRGNAPSNLGLTAMAQRWASTSAITSLTINFAVDFAIGSTFSLYGIKGVI